MDTVLSLNAIVMVWWMSDVREYILTLFYRHVMDFLKLTLLLKQRHKKD